MMGEDVLAAARVDVDDFLKFDPDDVPLEEVDLLVSFFVPFALVALLAGSAVSDCPLRDRKSAMVSSLFVGVSLMWFYSMLRPRGHPMLRNEIGLSVSRGVHGWQMVNSAVLRKSNSAPNFTLERDKGEGLRSGLDDGHAVVRVAIPIIQ